MSEPSFVVRTLPTTSLKGAFRVHMSPESLSQLNLQTGEICTIIGEDGTRGTCFAWRAADKMGNTPKSQSAKMTEILREAFGFKQGSQVRIEKASRKDPLVAKRVLLSEVTPGDDGIADDGRSKSRCIAVLNFCEAIAVGTTFDVSIGDKLKKRYFVEAIESDAAQDASALYYSNDSTQIEILDGPLSSVPGTTSQMPLCIDNTDIGGLQRQIDQLNKRLQLLCSTARALHTAPIRSPAILLYGFTGTGKSLLLKALSKVSGLKKVVSIDDRQLLETPSKAKAILQGAFQEACLHQPSLILVDNLDTLASSGDAATAGIVRAFHSAFDLIQGKQVLVIAAARDKSAVDSTLFFPDRFEKLIEIAVPDVQARADILTALCPGTAAEVAETIARSTHGFTGADLKLLVHNATDRAWERQHNEHELWTVNNRSSPPSIDARAESIASTLVDQPSPPELTICMHDFEAILETMRPSALREVIIEPPNVTFDDIGGSAGMRARFDEILEWPTKYADVYASLGEKKAYKGVLLYGPPGCSKTMTAQAVASTYGWNFIAVRGAELISMYVGESERAVRDIFRKARQAAPTIIFFDEIDSIATARSGSADSSRSLNVVTTLLNEMDGFAATENVLVLAATNQPASLDPAILRAGRFDQHVYLGPPDADARREILLKHTGKLPGGNAIDLHALVNSTDGMSGAEIVGACSKAQDAIVRRTITESVPLQLTTQDLTDSVAGSRRVITRAMLQTYDDFARMKDKQ